MPTFRTRTLVEYQLDEEDRDLAKLAWSLCGGRYLSRREKDPATEERPLVLLHRVVALRMGIIDSVLTGTARGKWTISVDHINGDKLDNRRTNLRLATREQQMSNRNDPLQRNNSSGERNVSWSKATAPFGKPWRVRVMVDGKEISLGTYQTITEAAAARDRWEATGEVPPDARTQRTRRTSAERTRVRRARYAAARASGLSPGEARRVRW
jgi:hypothetical protein